MRKTSFNYFLEELIKLSQEELKELKERAEALLIPANSSLEEELFYSAITLYLKSKGISSASWYSFKKTPVYRKHKEAYEHLQEFMKLHCKGITRVGKIKLFNIYAYVVSEQLKSKNIPVSVKTVLNSHKNFESYVDTFFPSYLTGGLFLRVLEGKKQEDIYEE